MKPAGFTKAGMLGLMGMPSRKPAVMDGASGVHSVGRTSCGTFRGLKHLNRVTICQPQGQLIPMGAYLNRISHRRVLDHSNRRPRDDSHIKQMLPKLLPSPYLGDDRSSPNRQMAKGQDPLGCHSGTATVGHANPPLN